MKKGNMKKKDPLEDIYDELLEYEEDYVPRDFSDYEM